MGNIKTSSICCIICNKGRQEGLSLYRINKLGIPGLWACKEHYSQTDASKIDPHLEEIVNAFREKK